MNASRSNRTWHTAAGLLAALGVAALVIGCAGGGGAQSAEKDDADSAARLTAANSGAAAKDLEELYKLMKSPPPSTRQRERDAARAVPAPSPVRAAPKTASADASSAPLGGESTPPTAMAGGASAASPSAPSKPMPAPPTPAERQTAVVAELMELLRERSATSADPAGDAALLAILSSLDPSAADAPLSEVSKALSPAQQQALRALQSLAAQLPAAMSQEAGGAGELARLLERIARQVGAPEGGGALGLPTVALCSRVEAFGRFTPLPSSVLLAGRAQRAIVYTEVENFAHQPMAQSAGDGASDAAQWVVELAQRVSLYHADGTLAWRTPEETLRDASRNVRRDFYLVQRIDLPPTLSVGAYNLKVTVRDLQSGATAERVIALSVVADPELAGR